MFAFILLVLVNQENYAKEVNKVQDEIRIINLINGLELTAPQMEFIIDKTKEVENIKKNLRKDYDYYKNSPLETFTQLKESRMADGTVPDQLRDQVYSAEGKIHDNKVLMSEALDKVAQEVEAKLEGNQIYVLQHYIPCLIPPPNSDSRIGQSEKPLGLTEQLNRIRKMPEHQYENKKDLFVNKAVEKLKNHAGPATPFNENAERTRILGILDEIRNTSDIDFTLKAEEYSERLKGAYFINNTPVDVSVKIKEFLLSPLVIPILEQKLAK